LTIAVPGRNLHLPHTSDLLERRDCGATMTKNCPCCGLIIREPTAVCPLCNERLFKFNLRTRHVLSALLALEICVLLTVLV